MSYSITRPCLSCGVGNRVPARYLANTGRCGSCKATLQPVSQPLPANTETFDAIVNEAQVPVLVDFWAGWCGPCRMLGPVLEQVARDYKGKLVLAKVDVDANQESAGRFEVSSIPAVKLFIDGEVVDEFVGAIPAAQVREFLARHLD